jgi:hypothetical protein
MRQSLWLSAFVLAAIGFVPAPASADFINGGFELGTFAGWSINNTADGYSTYETISAFDIDGLGPLQSSLAANFSVGTDADNAAGIELTQGLTLQGGTTYQFSLDWAAVWNNSSDSQDQGGIFDLIVDGVSLAHGLAGEMTPLSSMYGSLSTAFIPATTGDYNVGVRITREWAASAYLTQHVDNFSATGPTAPIPEPASLILLGTGLSLLGLAGRRRGK